MSNENNDRIDLVQPAFTRGQLRELEMRSIEATFAPVRAVVRMVNDGKEATVYLCRTADGLAAAKIFRAEKFRAFRNTREYLDPARMRDRRAAKAIRQGSRRGKRLSHDLWVDREWDALVRLHEAGASVPRPLSKAESGILMEYLGDEATAAPNLVEARLAREEAEHAWVGLLRDVERMLDLGLIHGDLSGYNVLYWDQRARIIDLPQVQEVAVLGNAFDLLCRDLHNVAQPFLRAGLVLDPVRLAVELARRFL